MKMYAEVRPTEHPEATPLLPSLEPSDHLAFVDGVLASRGYKKSDLIGVLQDIQGRYSYLPEELLTYVAQGLRIKPATVFGVATFYSQFSLQPKGKYVVRICDGTACHIKNSEGIHSSLRKKLRLSGDNFTTPDRLFTLEIVRCLGACGIAPVMVINEQVHPQLTPEAAVTIVDALVRRESGSGGEETTSPQEATR